MPWYQPLAEMQAFSELTGSGLGGLWGLVHRPGMSRRGMQFDLLKARLGDGWTRSNVE